MGRRGREGRGRQGRGGGRDGREGDGEDGRGRGREGTVHPPQCSLAVGATALSLSLSLSLLFIETKDDGSGDDNWSYKTCKAPVNSHHQQTNTQFLQAGYPSCRPTNSVKAKGNEPYN